VESVQILRSSVAKKYDEKLIKEKKVSPEIPWHFS